MSLKTESYIQRLITLCLENSSETQHTVACCSYFPDTVKPAYDGTGSNKIFFRFTQVPFHTGSWSLNLRDCNSYPLKTNFRYVHVSFKAGLLHKVSFPTIFKILRNHFCGDMLRGILPCRSSLRNEVVKELHAQLPSLNHIVAVYDVCEEYNQV
jgi:hypothetical protein